MSEIQIKNKTIREYLLGRISNQKLLSEIEDSLFSDDEFCDHVELMEDSLINEYAFGKLVGDELIDFEKSLENNLDRGSKVEFAINLREKAQSHKTEEKVTFFDSIKALFRQPLYAGGFGLLLIVVLFSVIYFLSQNNNNELAELKNLYKNERPITARISNFEYAPYVAERSESLEESSKNKLRLIENKLLEAVETESNAANYHALGVFYLTQRKFDESIENLQKAVELDSGNSSYQNDLGTAYFEFARNGKKENRLENLAKANEEFTEAYDLNEGFLAALFNRSLVLEELNLPKQAEESWRKYLEKDSSSKWAEEAGKHLKGLRQKENSFKTKGQVLEEFQKAYRYGDEKRLWEIHNQTKGIFNGVALHQQLTKEYLLARKQNDEQKAKENLEALKKVGVYEKEEHADFFFAELADYYSKLDESKIDILLEAKESLLAGHSLIMNGKYRDSIKSFEKSKASFLTAGNNIESNIAELWVAEMLPDLGKIEESQKRLNSLVSNGKDISYRVFLPTAYYWKGVGKFRQKKFSDAIAERKTALQIAGETENVYEIKHISEGTAVTYNFLGEFTIALKYLSIATDIKDSFYSSKAQIWRNRLATSQLLEKVNLDSTAIDFSNESLSFSKEYLSKTPAVDASLRESIQNLSKKGKFAEALNFAIEANKIALEKGETSDNFNIIADSFLEMANVKTEMGNCLEALGDFEKSLEFFEKIPETTFNLYEVRKGRLLCFKKLNRKVDFQNELKIVLNTSEEYRQNIRQDSIRQAFFESEQVIFDTAVYDAIFRNEEHEAFEFLEKSKARSLFDFIKSNKSISEIEREFSTVSKPLSIDEIQARMSEKVQIVQYSLLRDKLAIWVIENDKFVLFEKNINLTELENKIQEYRKAILRKDSPENLEAVSKEFFQLLIPKGLDENKTLCLILDKSLNQIPFASLISPKGKYLIEDFAVFYSPSSSVLVVATENAEVKKSEESLLTIGNPQFDRDENPNLADLPNAEIEAETIALNYKNSTKFSGENATKENFLNNFENAEVIHFAGHYVANGQSSSNSKLVFADANLRSFELSEKRLNKSKLVVLSACETAFEKINRSEGAVGIGRKFLAMGTPVVIASNWKVDSDATKDLMIGFHQKRSLLGVSTIESLRQAQLEMLQNEKTKSPYYWSAFSVIGGFAKY